MKSIKTKSIKYLLLAVLFTGCGSTAYPFLLQNVSQKKMNHNVMLFCNDMGIPLDFSVGEYRERKIVEDQQCTMLQYDTDGKEKVWFSFKYIKDNGDNMFSMGEMKIDKNVKIFKRTYYMDNGEMKKRSDGKLIKDYLKNNNIEL